MRSEVLAGFAFGSLKDAILTAVLGALLHPPLPIAPHLVAGYTGLKMGPNHSVFCQYRVFVLFV